MSRKYSNPWSGGTQFYKGSAKKLPTSTTDKDYLEYCAKKKNKNKILPYDEWVKKEFLKYNGKL